MLTQLHTLYLNKRSQLIDETLTELKSIARMSKKWFMEIVANGTVVQTIQCKAVQAVQTEQALAPAKHQRVRAMRKVA